MVRQSIFSNHSDERKVGVDLAIGKDSTYVEYISTDHPVQVMTTSGVICLQSHSSMMLRKTDSDYDEISNTAIRGTVKINNSYSFHNIHYAGGHYYVVKSGKAVAEIQDDGSLYYL